MRLLDRSITHPNSCQVGSCQRPDRLSCLLKNACMAKLASLLSWVWLVKNLYFEAGAREVWICDNNGGLSFLTTTANSKSPASLQTSLRSYLCETVHSPESGLPDPSSLIILRFRGPLKSAPRLYEITSPTFKRGVAA